MDIFHTLLIGLVVGLLLAMTALSGRTTVVEPIVLAEPARGAGGCGAALGVALFLLLVFIVMSATGQGIAVAFGG